MEAERQQRGALPVGEEAEVADAYEAAWQQVEQEAAQELVDRQSKEPLLVGVRGISPAEGDVALLKGDQSAVGDGDAVGLTHFHYRCRGEERQKRRHSERSSESPSFV